MSQNERADVVASFPLPPKLFYEHLSLEEIVEMVPPGLECLAADFAPFGLPQNTRLGAEDETAFGGNLAERLHACRDSMQTEFMGILENIELVQEPEKVQQALTRIENTARNFYEVMRGLRLLQAKQALHEEVNRRVREIEDFINE